MLMSQIYRTVPLPWTIATVELSIGLLCSTVFWLVHVRLMPDLSNISAKDIRVITKVVVYNMIGHLFMVLTTTSAHHISVYAPHLTS